MGALHKAGQRRRVRSLVAAIVAGVAVAALVAAFAMAPGAAAPRETARSVTLTFAGQVLGEGGLADFVDPYPPIEGGAALDYTVPAGYRLVIDSLYADVAESWVPGSTYQRSSITVGVSSAYDLGEQCAYPGWQRSYDIPLTTNASMIFGPPDEAQGRRAGSLAGPIFVEGGRNVVGTAWAPGGDSTVYVHVVAHGRLEPAANPTPPTCNEG